MPSFVFLNREIVPAEKALLPYNDRGFTLADGLFETLRIANGHVLALAAHLQRLEHGAGTLRIPLPAYSLEEAIDNLVTANRLGPDSEATLRLTLSRGPGPRGLAPPAEPNSSLIISTDPAPLARPPARLTVSSVRRNERSPLSRMKTLAYTENVLAVMEAKEAGFEDALLLNCAGRVSCATHANVFFLIDDAIITPPLDEGVLPGITRAGGLKLAADFGFAVLERPISLADIARAEAAFLTNSVIFAHPIHSIGNRIFPNPAKIASLIAAFRTYFLDEPL